MTEALSPAYGCHMMAMLDRSNREPDTVGERLNKLRAGVLGANDGIVSVAATVIGVAAATTSVPVILTAGLAALAAGAFSMAAGEYISVSTQRDTEKAVLGAQESHHTLEERLVEDMTSRGVSAETAKTAAREMTAHDPSRALGSLEGIDPDDLVNPWHAAFASMLSFVAGAIIPLVTILATPTAMAVPATMTALIHAGRTTTAASSAATSTAWSASEARCCPGSSVCAEKASHVPASTIPPERAARCRCCSPATAISGCRAVLRSRHPLPPESPFRWTFQCIF